VLAFMLALQPQRALVEGAPPMQQWLALAWFCAFQLGPRTACPVWGGELHEASGEVGQASCEMEAWLEALDELGEVGSESDEQGCDWEAALEGLLQVGSPEQSLLGDSAQDDVNTDCPEQSLGDCAQDGSADDDGERLNPVTDTALATISDASRSMPERVDALARVSRTFDDTALDAECVRVAEHFTSAKIHVSNASAEAEALGVDRRKARRWRLMSAAAAVQLEKHCWAHLESCVDEHLEAGRVKVLCYLEVVTYDGVDMKVQTASAVAQDSDVLAGGSDDTGAASGGQDLPVAPAPMETCIGKAKLVNGESAIAMLLEIGGKLALLCGEFLTWLQAVDRNTGESLLTAIAMRDYGTQLREKARRKIRLAITDAARYNFRAERGIMATRPGWFHIHLRCDVHVAAAVHSSVYGLSQAKEAVRGMTAISLSLRNFGQMALFRESMKRVLRRTLRLVYVQPSKPANAYRELVLNTFLGCSARSVPLRLVLSRFASGDWRKVGVFEYLACHNDTLESVHESLCTHFVPMILQHAPSTWPQNGWTGFDRALMDIGLLACIHGLLQATYRDYLEVNYKFKAPSAPDTGAPAILDEGEGMHASERGAENLEGGGDWASENRAHRKGAAEWLQQDRSTDMLVMRLVLSPMKMVLDKMLQLSGGVAKTLQVSSLLQFGPGPDAERTGRLQVEQWPILMAAEGVLEKRALEDIAALHRPDLYLPTQESDTTVVTNHLLFRLLSREAATIHQRLLIRHRQFPFRLFRLVSDPGCEGDIAGACQSSQDSYSKGFLEEFRGKLLSPEAQMELRMMVVFGMPNTVKTESSNATIRRRVVATSVQSHIPRLSVVSAEHVLGKLRCREHDFNHPKGSKGHSRRLRKATSKFSGGAKARKKVRRGGGGAWRAFVSKRCRGIEKATFHTLARDYAGLTAEQKAEVSQEGSLATKAHKAGGRSFGMTPRELGRVVAKRRLAQLAGRQDEDHLALLPYGQPGKALALQTSEVGEAVKRAKIDSMIFRRVASYVHEDAAKSIVDWRGKEAFTSRDRFVAALPGIARMAPCVRSEPVVQGADFVLSWMVPLGSQVPRLLGLEKRAEYRPFLRSLVEEWGRMHCVVKHDECRPVHDEPVPNYRVKPSCFEAQFCLCHARGDRIWSLKLWMCSAMKKALPTADHKSQFDDAYVVLRVTGFDDLIPDGMDPQSDEQFAGEVVFDLFVHVSFMCWKPYRPTFRRLSWPGHKIDHLQRLHLMGSHSYQSMLEFLAEVADHDPCSLLLQGYEIADSEELLPELNPSWVLASRVRSSKSQVWASTRTKPRRVVGRAEAICDADPGWDAALAALGDDLPEDDLDEGIRSEGSENDSEGDGHLPDSDLDSEPVSLEDLANEHGDLPGRLGGKESPTPHTEEISGQVFSPGGGSNK